MGTIQGLSKHLLAPHRAANLLDPHVVGSLSNGSAHHLGHDTNSRWFLLSWVPRSTSVLARTPVLARQPWLTLRTTSSPRLPLLALCWT